MIFRTRTRGGFAATPLSSSWFSTDKSGGCTGSMVRTNRGPITVSDYTADHRYMYDVVVKGYRRRSAAGEVFFNPASSRHTVINPLAQAGVPLLFLGNYLNCTAYPSPWQTIYELPSFYPYSQFAGLFSYLTASNGDKFWLIKQLLSGSEIENAISEASTKCHSNRGRSPVNFWETLAERKQSYALLSSYAQEAKKIALNLEIGTRPGGNIYRKIVSSSKLTQAVAGGWLITRYGLLPLIRDIRSLMTQLRTTLDEAERHTSRGKSSVGRSTSEPYKLAFDVHLWQNGAIHTTDEVIVRATSLDEWKYTVLDHFGLGSKDLVTLPWELLTLSFVADWFINVGDFIGALVPTPGVKQLGSCYSIRQVQSLTATCSGYSPQGIASISSNPSFSKTGTIDTMNRLNGLRSPSLVVLNRSKVDPELVQNQDRIVDACALVGQRLATVARQVVYAISQRRA